MKKSLVVKNKVFQNVPLSEVEKIAVSSLMQRRMEIEGQIKMVADEALKRLGLKPETRVNLNLEKMRWEFLPHDKAAP